MLVCPVIPAQFTRISIFPHLLITAFCDKNQLKLQRSKYFYRLINMIIQCDVCCDTKATDIESYYLQKMDQLLQILSFFNISMARLSWGSSRSTNAIFPPSFPILFAIPSPKQY